jgi:two-component system, response regulator
MNDHFILLVEDNPDDVALTQMAFKKSGIPNKLVVATDGQEALGILLDKAENGDKNTDHNPVLVLLDLKLPYVSGLDVLKQIRSDKSIRQIPVIVLTSSMEEDDRIESYLLGANDYIRKPTGFSQFVEIVQKIKTRWLDSPGENPQYNRELRGFELSIPQFENFLKPSFAF